MSVFFQPLFFYIYIFECVRACVNTCVRIHVCVRAPAHLLRSSDPFLPRWAPAARRRGVPERPTGRLLLTQQRREDLGSAGADLGPAGVFWWLHPGRGLRDARHAMGRVAFCVGDTTFLAILKFLITTMFFFFFFF